MGNKLPNQVINENGDDLTRVFHKTTSSYQEEMLNSQLHISDSSPEYVMSPPCYYISLECIIEDEPESNNDHVVDLSSSQFVYVTQKFNLPNDIVTCSNVRGMIQVDDDDNNTCDSIINK